MQLAPSCGGVLGHIGGGGLQVEMAGVQRPVSSQRYARWAGSQGLVLPYWQNCVVGDAVQKPLVLSGS